MKRKFKTGDFVQVEQYVLTKNKHVKLKWINALYSDVLCICPVVIFADGTKEVFHSKKKVRKAVL